MGFPRGHSSSGPAATPPTEDKLERVFRMHDMNGDGKISVVELPEMMAKLGYAPVNEYEEIMKEADADGDGFISFDEFKNIINGADEVALRIAFAVYDDNRDGKISASDLQKALTGMGDNVTIEECEMMIKGVDLDGDEMISFQEFKMVVLSGSRC